jgi:hypothetical protein
MPVGGGPYKDAPDEDVLDLNDKKVK